MFRIDWNGTFDFWWIVKNHAESRRADWIGAARKGRLGGGDSAVTVARCPKVKERGRGAGREGDGVDTVVSRPQPARDGVYEPTSSHLRPVAARRLWHSYRLSPSSLIELILFLLLLLSMEEEEEEEEEKKSQNIIRARVRPQMYRPKRPLWAVWSFGSPGPLFVSLSLSPL